MYVLKLDIVKRMKTKHLHSLTLTRDSVALTIPALLTRNLSFVTLLQVRGRSKVPQGSRGKSKISQKDDEELSEDMSDEEIPRLEYTFQTSYNIQCTFIPQFVTSYEFIILVTMSLLARVLIQTLNLRGKQLKRNDSGSLKSILIKLKQKVIYIISLFINQGGGSYSSSHDGRITFQL